MNPDLLRLLACPKCRRPLDLVEPDVALTCASCGTRHPIHDGIPRFVPAENYSQSFGNQWNRFHREQMDSLTGNSLSREQFDAVTRWTDADLRGKWVLDVGCGAGRFSEIALSRGANVVAVDMSSAVDACRRNLAGRFPATFHVLQASLYDLPLRPEAFDAVFSIGVIQHTPDPREAIRQVARQAKPGGKVAVWIYELSWRSFLGCNAWKYGLRPVTRLLGSRFNYAFAWFLTALLFPVWYPLVALGRIGKPMLFLLPVAAKNYAGVRLGFRDCFRCVVLDTFDWYSPAYDRPQRLSTIMDLLKQERCAEVTRTCAGVGVSAVRLSG